MTDYEKEQIRSLRKEGLGYKKTAQTLGISVDAVKAFCRKEKLTGKTQQGDICPSCGKPLVQIAKRKRRKFCSDQCREKWWSKNRSKGNKPTGEIVCCACCGKEFSAYKYEHRKYCSHDCYIRGRWN